MPYTGSKNAVAEWVIEHLPPAENFVDLFCGGCAVTHCAMLSGKYRYFIANDIVSDITQFFVECMQGLHTPETHKEFITSEQFHKLKHTDTYVSVIWSFGNNRTDYIYAQNIEHIKHAFHNAIFFGDYTDLKALDIKCETDKTEIYDRYIELKNKIVKTHKNDFEFTEKFRLLQHLENLGGIMRCQVLERLESLERLEILNGDYQSVKIPENSVIYCDIPYKGTRTKQYNKGADFDYERFYKWAAEQDNIYISEYAMPEPFIEVANIEKTVLCANYNGLTATERLYTNEKTLKRNPHLADYEQLLFF